MTHVSLGRGQAELDQADFGLLNTAHTSVSQSLGQNQSFHQLTVVDSTAKKQKQKYFKFKLKNNSMTFNT